jgi:dinuclear metal center YbgI/SA1388 family protein
MQIHHIIQALEHWAPLAYQEDYDNCGLLVGNKNTDCSGILISLDVTEDVLQEAIQKKCNLIVAHHPLIFKGIKKINGANQVERIIVSAIKNDIAIYAIHTNLDNVIDGVNNSLAKKLGLQKTAILQPKNGLLSKLYTFVPPSHKEAVLNGLFKAGAGHIGLYSECSFGVTGTGTFLPKEGTLPFSGIIGNRNIEAEEKIEVIFPSYLKNNLIQALLSSHPYEEVAYDIIELKNNFQNVGSGLIGYLPETLEEKEFLTNLKRIVGTPAIRHSPLLGKKISKVALCGGAGVFLTGAALRAGADIFITADVKYHDFFEPYGRLVLADIGHFESEQFTIDRILAFLSEKFPTFAVLKTEVKTNPVGYFF